MPGANDESDIPHSLVQMHSEYLDWHITQAEKLRMIRKEENGNKGKGDPKKQTK